MNIIDVSNTKSVVFRGATAHDLLSSAAEYIKDEDDFGLYYGETIVFERNDDDLFLTLTFSMEVRDSLPGSENEEDEENND